jgi:dipeptidyl aminopeptidase/acylaminoacyl peptidase
LVWVDRSGAASPLPLPPSVYEHPRLSADARTIVVARNEPSDRHLWVYDVGRDTLGKFTFESNNDWPVLSADGRILFFAKNRPGTQYDIVSRPVDGSGPEQIVLARPLTQIPRAAAPVGDALIFEETYPDRPNTLWRMTLPPGADPRPLLGAGNGEMMPTFSPDGRWVAYTSPQSTRSEIYVRSSTGDGRTWQISNNGGVEPVWSFSGRELFYRADDKMMTVDVSLGLAPEFGRPRVLFEGSYIFGSTEGQAFDVTRDGKRFLMLKPQRPLAAEPLQVIVNWFDAVRQREAPSR